MTTQSIEERWEDVEEGLLCAQNGEDCHSFDESYTFTMGAVRALTQAVLDSVQQKLYEEARQTGDGFWVMILDRVIDEERACIAALGQSKEA